MTVTIKDMTAEEREVFDLIYAIVKEGGTLAEAVYSAVSTMPSPRTEFVESVSFGGYTVQGGTVVWTEPLRPHIQELVDGITDSIPGQR